jgi:hypothetical protein
MTNYNSTNPVILQFTRFAGGKFFGQCLALSRHAVPQDKTMAKYLMDNPLDYEYRTNCLTQTLPPSLEEMGDWINKYELGDAQIYGPSVFEWRNTGTRSTNPVTKRLSNSEFKFFIVNHAFEQLSNVLKVWPNATVILFTNFRKFFDVASKLKSRRLETIAEHAGNYYEEHYDMLKGPQWPTWKEFETALFDTRNLVGYNNAVLEEIGQYYTMNQLDAPVINFDVDGCIFDGDRFTEEIKRLYDILGFDDFNPKLIMDIWKSYIALHR